jgi:tRNA(adenine34) deaminase
MIEKSDPLFTANDETWMEYALKLAKKAAGCGEVPVGAVVVKNNAIIGEGFNQRESKQDPLLHAELIAIGDAARHMNAWRLSDATLYVTLEPCLMCAGAIVNARIPRVVFAAMDPKAGACGSLYSVHEDTRLNHRYLVQTGLRSEESSKLLKDFFRARRG